MRNLFYYYSDGMLIFKYIDEFGYRSTHRYIFYTLKEAIKQFRQNNNLQYKHITVQRLY